MAEEKMIRGAGRTCIFFHNWRLSQHRLGGKHPSLPDSSMCSLYINISYKMAFKAGQKFQNCWVKNFRTRSQGFQNKFGRSLGRGFQKKMAWVLGRDFQNREKWKLEWIWRKEDKNWLI